MLIDQREMQIAIEDLKRLVVGIDARGNMVTMRVFIRNNSYVDFETQFFYGRGAKKHDKEIVRRYVSGLSSDVNTLVTEWKKYFGEPSKEIRATKLLNSNTKRIQMARTKDGRYMWVSWIIETKPRTILAALGPQGYGVPTMCVWDCEDGGNEESLIDDWQDVIDLSTLISDVAVIDHWQDVAWNLLASHWELGVPPYVSDAARAKIMATVHVSDEEGSGEGDATNEDGTVADLQGLIAETSNLRADFEALKKKFDKEVIKMISRIRRTVVELLDCSNLDRFTSKTDGPEPPVYVRLPNQEVTPRYEHLKLSDQYSEYDVGYVDYDGDICATYIKVVGGQAPRVVKGKRIGKSSPDDKDVCVQSETGFKIVPILPKVVLPLYLDLYKQRHEKVMRRLKELNNARDRAFHMLLSQEAAQNFMGGGSGLRSVQDGPVQERKSTEEMQAKARLTHKPERTSLERKKQGTEGAVGAWPELSKPLRLWLDKEEEKPKPAVGAWPEMSKPLRLWLDKEEEKPKPAVGAWPEMSKPLKLWLDKEEKPKRSSLPKNDHGAEKAFGASPAISKRLRLSVDQEQEVPKPAIGAWPAMDKIPWLG